MLKKNIVFIAQSLDGYIAGPDGALDWLHAIPNPTQDDMGFLALLEEVDAVVMGRTTFETVCGFDGPWPYQKPVYVLSTSLSTLPAKAKEHASLLSGSPVEVLAQIHAEGHHALYIDGGRTVQDFLLADLIDELRITTIPILLGGGFPLFGTLQQRMAFSHSKTNVYLGEVVQSHYVRNRTL